jgi:hypothetical protein
MHVFRIILKERNKDGAQTFVDLAATPETSLVTFGQAIKAQGGVCNEMVAVPYENILFVIRMNVPGPEGINAPVMGSA